MFSEQSIMHTFLRARDLVIDSGTCTHNYIFQPWEFSLHGHVPHTLIDQSRDPELHLPRLEGVGLALGGSPSRDNSTPDGPGRVGQ
jgi:hypothetical protein